VPNKFHTELANYYSKTFDTKVSPQFVERNMDALTGEGWYWEGMDFTARHATTELTRDNFLQFCHAHKALTQQELWKLCTEFAAYCKEHYEVNMSKTWYFKNYSVLVKQGYLYPTMSFPKGTKADAEARDKFIKFITSLDKAPKEKPKPKKKSQGSELGLALWFINKIGDLERAKKVFNAACLAAEALE